jgi:ABC-type multidrug transport system fused ATPase/permease subunit
MVMELPVRNNQAALTYAFLLWLSRIISAQDAMLSMWFGRRCYERTRGELIGMIYEKALRRKAIVNSEKPSSTSTASTSVNGTNGSANGTNGSANGSTNGSSSDPGQNAAKKENETPNGATKAGTEKKKSSRSAQLQLIKEVFTGRKHVQEKNEGPATTGQILNIVRTDVDEIAQRFRQIASLIKIPFGTIFSVWLIWRLLGPSCFLAIFTIAFAHFVNGWLTRVTVKWRRYLKEARDARVQMNSQYIDTIRHLRWYSWHETWLAKVMATRQHELNIRIVTSMLNILGYVITVSAGNFFPVVAFFAYTVIGHKPLRVDLIFPALQLFNLLQTWLRAIPNLIEVMMNAYVAMERIEKLMHEPDRPAKSDVELHSSPVADTIQYRLENCTFTWSGASKEALSRVNLQIGLGLSVVYGKIGSGKTALLLALLGELDLASGDADIPEHETIGYCAQSPWLQSMSIRDNILFFSPCDEERYQSVLDACALLPDLATFKDGDNSVIGEK